MSRFLWFTLYKHRGVVKSL